MNRSSLFRVSGLALAIAVIASGANAAQLEEIIVTAQKRAESLQDVPISMTALSGSKIEDAGINSFTELSGYVPNMGISENAVNTIISMRGIGVGAQQSFEQSVGLYTDGVHMGRSRQIRTGLFDLGQVEVLRGPQGILFGKNALAGAINVTSASAVVGDDMSGKLSLSAESFDGKVVEGHINAPVSDTLAVRFAFKNRSDSGYMTNGYAASPYQDLPSTDETMWRLSASWEPNESTDIKFKHMESEYVRIGSTIAINQWGGVANLAASSRLMYGAMGAFFPEFGASQAAGILAPFRDAQTTGGCALALSLGADDRCSNEAGYEKPEGTATDTQDTSLSINIDLDNGYTLTSVTGKTDYQYEDGIDADGLPISFVGRADISDFSKTSQELRLASPIDQTFSWVTGTYYEEQEQMIDRTVIIDGTFGLAPAQMAALTGGLPTFLAFGPGQLPPTIPLFVNGLTMFNQAGTLYNYDLETEAWAMFFQGTYNFSDTLSLTAGVRYTEEDKAAKTHSQKTTDTTGLATPNPSPLLEAIIGASFASWPHQFDESRSTDQLMPAFNLRWEPSDTAMYYASYSEGFKSGGFNSVDSQLPEFNANGTRNNTVPGKGFEYDDETASSIEIGGKHTLMDGAMSVNWAVFTSEFIDQQVSTFVGLGFVVDNAASSSISGVEIDMAYQVSDALRIGANVGLLDGQYDSFPGGACTAEQASALLGLAPITSSSAVISADGCTAQFNATGAQNGSSQDLTGGQLGAKYSGALFADLAMPLSNGLIWMSTIDVNFTDGFFMTGDLDPIDYQDAYQKVNLRTGLQGENWDLMLYGKNVTDEITASGAADVPLAAGSHWRYIMPGASWGVRVGFKF